MIEVTLPNHTPPRPPAPVRGFKTALDTLIAPAEAFERLRDEPTWVMALILTFALAAIAFTIERPIAIHAGIGAIAHMLDTNPAFGSFTTAQKQRILESAAHPNMLQTTLAGLQTAVMYLAGITLNALLMFGACAVAGHPTSLRRMWAGSVNIALPTVGALSVVVATICVIAGADQFHSPSDIARATPSAALLLPDLHGFPGALLSSLNVFCLWGFVLNVLMLKHLAAVRGPVVWLAPAAVTLGGGVIYAALISAS